MNTKERGDLAVSAAIAYYMSHGYEVCIPIGNKRNYDLIIEKDTVVSRVQIKFAGIYKSGKCIAGLRITGGNQSYNYARKYTNNAFDILFIHTERGGSYALPWDKVNCRNELAIENYRYKRYKL